MVLTLGSNTNGERFRILAVVDNCSKYAWDYWSGSR